MKYCIFVERIFDDKCFEALKDFCNKKIKVNLLPSEKGDLDIYPMQEIDSSNINLFCLTPVNYDLVKAEQGFTGTKNQLSIIMAKRYKELEEIGCSINLHIHLGLRLENINQKRMFKEAVEWMHKNCFEPKTWTAGWYIYNNESLEIARKHNLLFFNDKASYSFHDYEYDKKFSPMMIITNLRGMLR